MVSYVVLSNGYPLLSPGCREDDDEVERLLANLEAKTLRYAIADGDRGAIPILRDWYEDQGVSEFT